MRLRIKLILYFLFLVGLSSVAGVCGYETQAFHPLVGVGLLLGLMMGFVITEKAEKVWMLGILMLTVVVGACLGYVASLEPNSFAVSDYYSLYTVFGITFAIGLGIFFTSSVLVLSLDE